MEIKYTQDKGLSVFALRAFAPGDLVWCEDAFLVSRLPLLAEAAAGYRANALTVEDDGAAAVSVSPLLTADECANLERACSAHNVATPLVHFLVHLWDQPREPTGRLLRELYNPEGGLRRQWVPFVDAALSCLPPSFVQRAAAQLRAESTVAHALSDNTIVGAALKRLFAAHDSNCYESAAAGCAEVYAVLCVVNHSCHPNAHVTPVCSTEAGRWHAAGGRVELRAVRSIAAGDEIFVSYLGADDTASARTRRHALRAAKGFDCACERCMAPCWFRAFKCPTCGCDSVPAPSDARADATATGAALVFQCARRGQCAFRGTDDGDGDDDVLRMLMCERRAEAALSELEEQQQHVLRQQQGGSGGGDQIDAMQAAWQQALASAERHLARGHWVVRSMLTHLRALLVGARPMRAVPAVRVQARVVASLAAGLLGSGAFDDDQSSGTGGSGNDNQTSNSGSYRVPLASSMSTSMAAAVADSASPLLRLALPPRSTLIDVDSHALAQRAFDAAPVFALATHGELLADLLALVAAALRRQEQQQQSSAPSSSTSSSSTSSSAGSAPAPAAMSTGLFADAARFFARALVVFERGSGALGADAVRVRGKLAQCAAAELSFATAADQTDADVIVVAAMRAAAELDAADGAAKAALAAAASQAKSELAVVETPNTRLLREIRIDLFLGLQELDVSRRGLDSLPDAIGTLRHLRKLNAANNPLLCDLPASVAALTELRTLFFLGCGFERIPRALGRLPHLFMLSFKSNRLEAIDEDALAPSIAWLILTDNRLRALPAALGRLTRLRKLMLASNRLEALPCMRACASLELVRLSDNRLAAHAVRASGVLALPRLAWIALAGNEAAERAATSLSGGSECGGSSDGSTGEDARRSSSCAGVGGSAGGNEDHAVPAHLRFDQQTVAALRLDRLLGEGASGTVFLSHLSHASTSARANGSDNVASARSQSSSSSSSDRRAIAIKVFKAAGSDGRAIDEIRAAVAVGRHAALTDIIGVYAQPPTVPRSALAHLPPAMRGHAGGAASAASEDEDADTDADADVVNPFAGRLSMAMALLDGAVWHNLGLPPTFASVTRDAFAANVVAAFTRDTDASDAGGGESGVGDARAQSSAAATQSSPAPALLPVARVLRVLSDIAAACAHVHSAGVAHGDIYAHNVLYRPAAIAAPKPSGEAVVVAKLSDFGAAFRYATLFRAEPSVERAADFDLGVFETIEVRAFACLVDDLLGMIACGADADADATGAALRALRDECWREDAPAKRPRFAQIALRLQKLARVPL